MLISLNWIKDYVDLPDKLDPRDLTEELTVTTAEVEGLERTAIDAVGLRVARIESVRPIADNPKLKETVLDTGDGKSAGTVTAAPVLRAGDRVIYAPPGASVAKLGIIRESTVAGRPSVGMILPGDALGMELAASEAVFLGDECQPGDPIAPELFEDWVIEIDNKSLTHRPDLWGHYGIAREIAAILQVPLKPYPTVPTDELLKGDLPEFPIAIADAQACRRYSGIVLRGVPTRPAPLWMQLRLGRIGLRPISGLVDLTNYIMTDLGQPMHAFDAALADAIEVDWAKSGETFETLDGIQRTLTGDDLMIQSHGRSVAIAGVMGGVETEVSDNTQSLLLESANFDPATIRRTAGRLGLRTDASARFEKSLDPAHTEIAIRRFIHLAQEIYCDLAPATRLSDCFPAPPPTAHVTVNPKHVARTIGTELSIDRATQILEPLGFSVAAQASDWQVTVPSYRAANDVSIEADVIEELARYVGYGRIEPAMPQVAMRRFEPNALHRLEKKTLAHFTAAEGFNEIYGYLWYDGAWLAQLGIDPGPCIELKNPAAAGLERFRRSLIPGLLAAANRNRHHFPKLTLIELGSVFEPGDQDSPEQRRVGLLVAHRTKKADETLLIQLKSAIERWAWQHYARRIGYVPDESGKGADPWVAAARHASILLEDTQVGNLSVIDAALKRKMDEHWAAWSIAWAELRLDSLAALTPRTETRSTIPAFPLVEMDFSFVVPATTPFRQIAAALGRFEHAAHRQTRFVDSYESKSVGPGKRSLTVRLVAGDAARTLSQADTDDFHAAFETHLKGCGYEIRK